MAQVDSGELSRNCRVGKFFLRASFELALISFTPSLTHRFAGARALVGHHVMPMRPDLVEGTTWPFIYGALFALLLGVLLTHNVKRSEWALIATPTCCYMSWLLLIETIGYYV